MSKAALTFFFLPFPVLGELWAGHQAAGNSLCLSEPNQTRRGSLQPSAAAAHTKSLPGSNLPYLENQQVAGGMFVRPPGFDNKPGLRECSLTAETQAQTQQKAFQRLRMQFIPL